MQESRVYYQEADSYKKLSSLLVDHFNSNTIVVCIGTNRIVSDCVGPLVGTLLKEKKFNRQVYGTLTKPIHALNIEHELLNIKTLNPDANIIAIDAGIGRFDDVGYIQFLNQPLSPGKGIRKTLPVVGDTSIIAIVDYSTYIDIFVNKNIELSFVMDVAQVIADALIDVEKKVI